MGTAVTIVLDLAKSVFQVHGVDEVVIRRRLTRAKVLDFFGKLPRCLVGIEACVAVTWPLMRFVEIKPPEQQSVQPLRRGAIATQFAPIHLPRTGREHRGHATRSCWQ